MGGWTLLLLVLAACTPADSPEAPRLSATAALGGSGAPPAGFARALTPRPFTFPADHGAHDDFQTEWWYFTGNLETGDGRRFGFQWTLFRRALAPAGGPERASAWATRQLYLAHFAVVDAGPPGRFRAFERAQRGALGLAGVDGSPFRAYLEDWQAASLGDEFLPLRLRAADEGVALDLELEGGGKPLTLHGDAGLSRKGAGAGNASFYYSATRLPARGSLTLDGQVFRVSGEAWLDREWSTSVLEAGQVGWDWFSLQLDDGRELMVFQLRRADGSRDPFSSGTLVGADGAGEFLGAADFTLEPSGGWRSPRSGALYPERWRLEVPRHGLTLEVAPLAADQELDVSFRYWEGAVAARGEAGGQQVAGRGYLEMVGYADAGQ